MLNELVLYCESLLDMSSCLKTQKISPTDCANCLKEIHFGNDNGREYDCLNMCCQYVCQNMHRYVTEMVYLFHDTYNQWIKNRQEQLVMCSIGCGPCSELVAWEEYARRQHLDIPYSYDGFDTNSMWSKIRNEVKSLVSPYGNVSFHNEDIFEYYSKREEKPNVIILNYLLSDIFRDDVLEGKAFIRSFLKFLSQLSTYAILINDINLGLSESHARYYFDRLASYLCRSSNNNVECMRWHFRDTKKNYFEYGEERHDSRILFDLPSKIINNNMPNTECHSAQLLIIRNNHDSECK